MDTTASIMTMSFSAVESVRVASHCADLVRAGLMTPMIEDHAG